MCKFKSSIMLLALMLFNEIAVAGECTTSEREGKVNEFSISDEDKMYKGYIALEDNGDWFVWSVKNGAMNVVYTTKEEAVNILCELP